MARKPIAIRSPPPAAGYAKDADVQVVRGSGDLWAEVWSRSETVQWAAIQWALRSPREVRKVRIPKGLAEWVKREGWNLSELVEQWLALLWCEAHGEGAAVVRNGGDAVRAIRDKEVPAVARKVVERLVAHQRPGPREGDADGSS